jgi:hypothetical protein
MSASPWYSSFQKALRLSAYIAAHAGVAVVSIVCVYVIRYILLLTGDPKLYDWGTL